MPPEQPSSFRPSYVQVVITTTLLGLLAACLLPRREPIERLEPQQAAHAEEDAPAPPVTEAEDTTLTRPMPSTPFPEQRLPDKRGKCGPREVAINGGCWVQLALPPDPGTGCGPSEYEYQGKCYGWVRDPKRTPRSVEKKSE